MSTSLSADLISSLGVNMAQCSLPQLMEPHTAGPPKTGKLGLISSEFTLQYVMIPKLSGGEREVVSTAQSLENWKVQSLGTQ